MLWQRLRGWLQVFQAEDGHFRQKEWYVMCEDYRAGMLPCSWKRARKVVTMKDRSKRVERGSTDN